MKRVLLLAVLTAGAAFCAFAQHGVIRELSGDVGLKLLGTSDFVPARAGDKVATDTVISTGFKSTAIIEAGSTLITVRPLTRLSFSEIQSASGRETVNADLQTGRVRVEVKPPAGSKAGVNVQCPGATASVRGTSFELDTYNLTVLEGTVVFLGNYGMPVPVPMGMNSYVNLEGRAADPVVTFNAGLSPSLPAGVQAGNIPVSLPPPDTGSGGSVNMTVNW